MKFSVVCVLHSKDLLGEPELYLDSDTTKYSISTSHMSCPTRLVPSNCYCRPDSDCEDHRSHFRIMLELNN